MTDRKSVSLLYLAPAKMADFVATDAGLLGEVYDVRPLYYEGKVHGLLEAPRILWAVATTDANVSWFAYRQAYFATIFSKILGKPSIVIIGGFDVSSEEWIGKEIPSGALKELRAVFRRASSLLAVSERIAGLARQYTTRRDLEVVPHGFDTREFRPEGPKDGSVATVAFIRRDYLERKGLMTFVRAARTLPGTTFYLIGKAVDESVEDLRREAPTNVRITGWLSRPDLIALLQKTSVYVQASTHEGFGSALAQAMLCECVPVTTNRGAIPEVVGDAGIYIEVGSPESLAGGIHRALDHPELGARARERVVRLFSLDRRRKALRECLEKQLR